MILLQPTGNSPTSRRTTMDEVIKITAEVDDKGTFHVRTEYDFSGISKEQINETIKHIRQYLKIIEKEAKNDR